nr:unnamed protein product [Haemonchus contortus]
MRNSKTNLMHDAVRRTAVAPIPKKFYRKSTATTYTDSALSENESDEYPKIRSYIKPNKNINTYNRGLREQRIIDKMCGFQKLNRSLSFNHQRSASHKPISSRFMSNEKKHFSPVVTACAKAPPTLPSHNRSENKAIIEEIVKTSEKQFKSNVEQSHRRTVPQSSEKGSQRTDCSLTKVADGSTTGVRWNEHMNLALFHSLRIKIFNSSTLPEEGKWDLNELSQVTTSKTKTLRKSARDSIGFDSSSFSSESLKKNVTFSEDLVTTIFYEATNQELTQVPVGDKEQSTDNEKVGEPISKTDPSSQKSLPLLTLEQIKREVEEDEVQILFSGKRKYIEALYRESREDQHSSKF